MPVDLAVIDSGGANLASLEVALKRLGVTPRLTREPQALREASHVILPGVGAALDAMQRLADANLTDVIAALTQPVLGICLGLQLLAERSEEDDASCLGVVPGVAARLDASPGYPVPNMGWCALSRCQPSPLLEGIDDGEWFYFVHSYAMPIAGYTLASANHERPFTAVLAERNFYATQFHPERSSAAGARVLENFLSLSV